MDKGFFSDPQNWQPASFRGVAFEVESHKTVGGRRLVRHEYPLRDTPWAEDLGRKGKDYQIDAFIIQGRPDYDYRTARDDLLKALDAAGAATLIHPSLGELTAAVDQFSSLETTKEGGYCQITITFVESGQREAPITETDTATATTDSVALAQTAADDEFSSIYAPELDELAGLVNTADTALTDALTLISMPAALYNNALQNWAELVAYPSRIIAAVRGAFALYGSGESSSRPHLGPNAQTGLPRLTARAPSLWRPAEAPPPPLTSDDHLRHYVATTAVLAAAAATPDIPMTTAQEAITTRNHTVMALDTLAALAPDPLYGPLLTVKRAVHLDLTTRAARLPQLTTTRLAAPLPALVVAYKTHADARRDTEIVSRNRLRNPCFCPAATPLEVVKG